MNREIKFRAWNIQINTMHDHKYLFCNYTADTVFNRAKEYELEIMQYTGLKDKNGKEIYEGDIVVADDNGEYFPEECDDDGNCKPCGKYKVVWECDYPAFDLRALNGDRLGMEFNPFTGEAEFEIIGNIYENGDLLNASTK